MGRPELMISIPNGQPPDQSLHIHIGIPQSSLSPVNASWSLTAKSLVQAAPLSPDKEHQS